MKRFAMAALAVMMGCLSLGAQAAEGQAVFSDFAASNAASSPMPVAANGWW